MSALDQQMQTFVNHTFDEIEVGSSFSFPHRLNKMEVDALAFVSGETDAFQVDTGNGAPKESLAEAVAGATAGTPAEPEVAKKGKTETAAADAGAKKPEGGAKK